MKSRRRRHESLDLISWPHVERSRRGADSPLDRCGRGHPRRGNPGHPGHGHRHAHDRRFPRGDRPGLSGPPPRRCLRGRHLLPAASGRGGRLPPRTPDSRRSDPPRNRGSLSTDRVAPPAPGPPGTLVSVLLLLADENFNGRILRALLRQIPDLDVVRAQDTTLYGADDPTLLQFAADEGRIVLTHDIETLVGYAWERVRSGKPMPGVIAALTDRPIGQIIGDLEILLQACQPGGVRGADPFPPALRTYARWSCSSTLNWSLRPHRPASYTSSDKRGLDHDTTDDAPCQHPGDRLRG